MRFFILILFALHFQASQAQHKEVKRIDLNLDIAALDKKGAAQGIARVLAVNDNFAIGQIGVVDVALFDLKSGNVIKYIDTDLVIKNLEKQIHRLLGGQYYVPNKNENQRSNYVGVIPYEYRGLFFLEEKGKFVTDMVIVVFNRNDELEQLLFSSLVLFDQNLDNIEIIPFDPKNRSTNAALINGGFFLGQDRLFTKWITWKNDHVFDFHEYRLTEDHVFTLVDTLIGIKTDTLGYINRFHSCFAFQDKNYLNLGSMLYSFENGEIRKGSFVKFPHKTKRYFLYIQPFDENHIIAYAINNYRSDPNPTGWLLLLDKDMAILSEIHAFNLRNLTFCSLFTAGKSLYVVNYDKKKENYFLLKYEDF